MNADTDGAMFQQMERGWSEDGARMERGWSEDGARMERGGSEDGARPSMERGWNWIKHSPAGDQIT
jgi:hypothetical protein